MLNKTHPPEEARREMLAAAIQKPWQAPVNQSVRITCYVHVTPVPEWLLALKCGE